MVQAMRDIFWTIVVVLSCLSEPEPATLSYYGTGSDGFFDQYHSAYWQGYKCYNMPDKVDDVHFGTAAPYWVPLCSHVVVCYNGKCLLATVVDRQRDDILFGKSHFDLWPAAARELGMVDAGIVEGKVWGVTPDCSP